MARFLRPILVFAVVIAGSLLPASKSSATIPFVMELADSTGHSFGPSLELDQRRNPHVAYWHQAFGDSLWTLIYAVREEGHWTFEPVDITTSLGGPTALALDGLDVPHLAYSDGFTGGIVYGIRGEAGWVLEYVDFPGSVDAAVGLAVDDRLVPHLVYQDDSNGFLRYAKRDLGSWVIGLVDTSGTVDPGADLVLDAHGRPHVSYSNALGLLYATNSKSAWSIDLVDTTGFAPTLALDDRGNPHIGYGAFFGFYLRYASRTTEGWTTTVMDSSIYSIGGQSIAVDAEGAPHLAWIKEYYSGGGIFDPDMLKYGVKRDGVWQVEEVGPSGWYLSRGALKLDSEGNAHLAYPVRMEMDLGNQGFLGQLALGYATTAVEVLSPEAGDHWIPGQPQAIRWRGAGTVGVLLSLDGGLHYETLIPASQSGTVPIIVPDALSQQAHVRIVRNDYFATATSPAFTIGPETSWPWWSRTVDEEGDVGAFPSLALDADAVPHISYYDWDNGDLKYAVHRGWWWWTDVVDTTGDVGAESSLSLGRDGLPHVSYYDDTLGDLKYARFTGDDWQVDKVDSTDNVGVYNSLALDDRGDAHVAYTDVTNAMLKYAVKLEGTWWITPVSAPGQIITDCSIALDAGGEPSISYYNLPEKDLEYAWREGGGWMTMDVDTEGDVGEYNSLVVDREGRPHIAYYSHAIEGIKYASRIGDEWMLEVVDEGEDIVGGFCSLGMDEAGTPHITYYDWTHGRLKHAVKSAGGWRIRVVDATGNTGRYTSMALDAQGNPHVSYYNADRSSLEYASAAVQLAAPGGGSVWPVGASRLVTWRGLGVVDLMLSVDGGKTYELLESDLTGGEHRLLVPHSPTRFARLKLERGVEKNSNLSYLYPRSVSTSVGLFTIESSVELLQFSAQPPKEGGTGVLISWSTDPGPADLDGYRLERRSSEGRWQTLMTLTRETSYHDTYAGAGCRYRLFAVNGLGEELLLGETVFGTPRPLGAWPLPYRGGELGITFATLGGLGGGTEPVELGLYDVRGRQVREILRRDYPAGVYSATWNGLDDAGRSVASGVYFLRSTTGGRQYALKVLVVRER